MNVKMVRVLIGSSTEGAIYSQDAVETEDGLLLVPRWLRSPDGRSRTPAIAIPLPKSDLQPAPPDSGAEWLLTLPIPTAALEGDREAIEAVGLEALEPPSERLPILAIPMLQ